MTLCEDDFHFSFKKFGGFTKTSPIDTGYNCIAWAADDSQRWWWPDSANLYFWPQSVIRECTIDAFIEAFATIGYEKCKTPDLKKEFKKVALFAKNNSPTHAAKQLVIGPHVGKWSSKMGPNIDIAHSLEGVSGVTYGKPVVFLKTLIKR